MNSIALQATSYEPQSVASPSELLNTSPHKDVNKVTAVQVIK